MQLVRICSYGLIVLAVSAPPVAAQEVLDLIEAARQRRPPPPGTTSSARGGFAAGSGFVRPRLPLEATLLSVAPRDLQSGEEFTYDVALKNRDSKDFKLPWSPERIEETKLNRPVVQAIISLRDVLDNECFFGTMGFYGSLSVKGSVRALKPGEEVIVRAGGRFTRFGNDWEAFISSLPRPITLRAQIVFIASGGDVNPAVSFNPPLFQGPMPVMSVNELTVKVRKPAKP